MEESEEPELFDMEVVSENPQDDHHDNCEFSDKVLESSLLQPQKGSIKRIIYIEEDSSDTSLDSNCDFNAEPHRKHTTQKITIENLVEKKQVSLKRKLDLNSTDQSSNGQRIKYSNLTGAATLNFSQLDKILSNVAIAPNTQKEILLSCASSSVKVISSFNSTSPKSPILSPKCPISNPKCDKPSNPKVDNTLRHSLQDFGPSSYYPSAFKLGLVSFSLSRSVQETANLFRIPKEVLIDWTNQQDKLVGQFQKDFFAGWEKDLFVDVITALSSKQSVLLKNVMDKRKAHQPSSASFDNASMVKWALDWCRQFRFHLDYNEKAPESSCLSLPGFSKTVLLPGISVVKKNQSTPDPASKVKIVSESLGSGVSANISTSGTFSPSFKYSVCRFASNHTVKDAARKHHLKMSTVRQWLSEHSVIEKEVKKRKVDQSQNKHKILEDELCEWYRSMTVKGKATRHSLIISKARSLARKLNFDDFEPTSQWYNTWWKLNLSLSKAYSKKAQQQEEESSLLKDEWKKLLEDSSPVSVDPMEEKFSNTLSSPANPNCNDTILLENINKEVAGVPDSGLEDSSDISSEKEHVLQQKRKSIKNLLNSSQPSAKADIENECGKEPELQTSSMNDIVPKNTSTDNMRFKNLTVNIGSAKSNVKESVAKILQGDMNVQVLVEKIKHTVEVSSDEMENVLTVPVSTTLEQESQPTETLPCLPNESLKPIVQTTPSEQPSSNAANCDISSESNFLDKEDNAVPFSTPAVECENDQLPEPPANSVDQNSTISGDNKDCLSSSSSSQNPSFSDSSPESSVFTSYDSNSSSTSNISVHRENLTGSFQQIFLKFAQDGNKSDNDQRNIVDMGSDKSSIHSNRSSTRKRSYSSYKDRDEDEEVQSCYELRNKAVKLVENQMDSQIRKQSIIKSLRLTPTKPIPLKYSSKSRTISRRLGYSFAAGALNKQQNRKLPDRQNTKLSKLRKCSKRKILTSKKSAGNEPKQVAKKDNQRETELEADDFEAPAYPACFQNRVIETVDIKGIEVACEEFGLQSSLVNDWMCSRNSIKMLSKVENFQDWELDLYIVVHKLNVKGQKLSLSDLVSKGSEILTALNLDDCFTFDDDNALDWCERFGVALSDMQLKKCKETESGKLDKDTNRTDQTGMVHHRQKHSNQFMAEVCSFTRRNSVGHAHRKYGIPISTIRSWVFKGHYRRTLRNTLTRKPTKDKDLLKQEDQGPKKGLRSSASSMELNTKTVPKSDLERSNSSGVRNSQTLNAHRIVSKFKSKAAESGANSFWNHKDSYLKYRKKYVNKKLFRSKYSDEFRQQVLEYARLHGIPSAAAYFKLNTSVVYHWGGRQFAKRRSHVKFSDDVKARVMDYADKFSISAASTKFSVSVSLIHSWRIQRKLDSLASKRNVETKSSAEPNNSVPKKARRSSLETLKTSVGKTSKPKSTPDQKANVQKSSSHSPDFIRKVVNYANDYSIFCASKKHGVDCKLLKSWVLRFQNENMKPTPTKKYSKVFKEQIISYAKDHSVQWAAKKHGLEYKLVKSWILQSQSPPSSGKSPSENSYSKAFVEKVVKYSLDTSVKSAAAHFSVPKSNVYEWLRRLAPQKGHSQKVETELFKDLEAIDNDLITWCQVIQANETLLRSSKVISKAKTICQQMNIDDSQVNQNWYKYWSAKYADHLSLNSVQELESSGPSQPKRARKSITDRSKTPEDVHSRPEYKSTVDETCKNSVSNLIELDNRDICAATEYNLASPMSSSLDLSKVDEASNGSCKPGSTNTSQIKESVPVDSPTSSPKTHTHFTRKIKSRFCKLCNVSHHHHKGTERNLDMTNNESDPVELKCKEGKKSSPNQDVFECDNPIELILNSKDSKDEIQDSSSLSKSSRTSTPSSLKKDINIVTRELLPRSCRSTPNKDENEEPAVSSKDDARNSGSNLVVVISDPGKVFSNWINEINDKLEILSSAMVKEKLEFIVERTNEDHFDNWLFRLYHDIVKGVKHSLFDMQNLTTVLGLNGYASGETKLDILNYASRTSVEEASSCFFISSERISEWKESEPYIRQILRLKDLFVTTPKNLHIDLDIYEWYLKTLVNKGSVDETELRLQAEEIYLEHGGKNLKRWYKWFLDRFNKVSALESIQNTILKSILMSTDCNLSLSTEKVLSMYDEWLAQKEDKLSFPATELWFKQFCEKYSDYLTQNFDCSLFLPDVLSKCEMFKNTIHQMESGLNKSCIGCMDEFPIWFTSKYDVTSSDPPMLPASGFSDADGVVLFSCLANGTMLSPFITFRNSKKPGGQASEHIVTDPVLLQWLHKVWLVEVTQPKSIVILDSFVPHTSEKFRQTAEQSNVQLALIPPGCNLSLLPICSGLRIRFQQLLKDLRKKRYADSVIGRSEIVSLVNDVYCTICKEGELVRSAFQVTGVIASQDGW